MINAKILIAVYGKFTRNGKSWQQQSLFKNATL